MRAIRVYEIGNFVFPVSLDDGLVKESCVSVSFNGPILFGSLNMVFFLFGNEILMFLVEFLLERSGSVGLGVGFVRLGFGFQSELEGHYS